MTFDPYYTWLGIPPEQQPPDHYRLLGLQRYESHREVIANAMDQRMTHLRSMQTGRHAMESQRLLNEVAAAGRCLLSDTERQAYDTNLRASEAVRTAEPVPVKAVSLDATSMGATSMDATSTDARSPAAPVVIHPIVETSTPAATSSTRVNPTARSASKPALNPWWITGGAVAVLLVAGLIALLSSNPSPQRQTSHDNNSKSAPPRDSSSSASSPKAATGVGAMPVRELTNTPVAQPFAIQPNMLTPRTTSPFSGQPAPTNNTSGSLVSLQPRVAQPAADLPQTGPFALDFEKGDGVTLSGTRDLVRWDRPFTLEMLVRFESLDREFLLLGNCLLGTSQGTAGWQLWLMPGKDSRSIRLAIATEQGFAGEVAVAPGWRHIAVSNDREHLRLFVDGRRCTTQTTALLARAHHESPMDLHVGVHSQLHAKQPGAFRGQLRGLRVTSECRYTENFQPPSELDISTNPSPQTELVLDFRQPQAGRIADLSRHQRHGLLRGARWCSVRESLSDLPPSTGDLTDNDRNLPKGPDTSAGASTATGDGTADSSPSPVDASTGPDGRRRVDDAALAAARRVAAETFAADLAAASKDDDKLKLSKRLVSLAESETAAADQLALYLLGHDVAMEAAGLVAALPIIDSIEPHFEFDCHGLRVADLRAMAAELRTPGARREFVDMAIRVSASAARGEAFELATEAARMAYSQASRTGDASLKRVATEARGKVEVARRRQQAATKAEQRIAQSPEDAPAEAQHTWGEYLCLVRHRWTEGLPHLAKSDRPSFRRAAELDLGIGENEKADSAQSLAAGDAWWSLAEQLAADKGRGDKSDVDAIQQRAVVHYRRAAPQLAGLDKIRANKRIQEGSPKTDPAAVAALFDKGMSTPLQTPPQVPLERNAMIGGLAISGMPQLMIRYQNGVRFSDESMRTTLRDNQIAPGRVLLKLHGLLLLEEPTTVLLRQRGGSLEGGRHNLTVNGRQLGEVGGDGTTTGVYRLALPRGRHVIQWLVQGGDLGNCQLLVINDEGLPLPLIHTPEMEMKLRQGRPLPTLAMLR